ncbi:hypothetical protein GAV44_23305 [Salmonella enterica subsp. enterica serovar Newport]|nr:hypothetical protein [Salmonella enterica subsp. enterica serovar Newport]
MPNDEVMTMGRNRATASAVASIERIAPKRSQMNIHPALHEAFRKISFNRDEEMSDILTQAIIDYVNEHGGAEEVITNDRAHMYLSKPKHWTP